MLAAQEGLYSMELILQLVTKLWVYLFLRAGRPVFDHRQEWGFFSS